MDWKTRFKIYIIIKFYVFLRFKYVRLLGFSKRLRINDLVMLG